MTTTGGESERSIVVGVDGSQRNRPAVAWAVAEAAATGRPLHLLAVLDDYAFPLPHHRANADDELEWTVLNRIAHEVTDAHPGMTVRRMVEEGGPLKGLLRHADRQHLLVVGKRGHGAFARVLAGSTSVGVAGRSQVPVVVVPDEWDVTIQGGDVLVGVTPDQPPERALRFAVAAADRRGVDLRVVHAVDPPPQLTWEPTVGEVVLRELQGERSEGLEASVAPLREKYPDLAVEIMIRNGHPGNVLLDEGDSAQLVVLGRSRPGVLGGLPLGSVSRGVLHHSTVPVAIVPTD
jgi:nucleotide-binding universal stress UspA family protein